MANSPLDLNAYRMWRARMLRGDGYHATIADVITGAIVRHSGLHREMQESCARLRAAYYNTGTE